MIPILILAAGRSSRMGDRDKLLEKIEGEPLLRRQARLAMTTNAPVVVALAEGKAAHTALLADLGVTVLTIPDAAEGMSGTLRGAVPHLPEAGAFMVLLCDLVALEGSDLQTVLKARAAEPDYLIWRGATEDGKPGHPIIFDHSLRPLFSDLSGDLGGEAIVKAHKDETCLVKLPGDRARFDLDKPEDWDRWRRSSR